jgi:hypothetical protein
MKPFAKYTLVAILSLGLSAVASAAPKKAAADAAAAAADTKKEDAVKMVKGDKPLPMHTRVDAVDTKAKTFTMKRKADGAEIKHTVPSGVEIKNGDADAKFEDIKVGDYVSGLRKKKSATEYEVVKITKIGPAPVKQKKEDKKAE